MKSLLIISDKFRKEDISSLDKKKNCEVIFIKKNLLNILNKIGIKYKKIILVTDKILSRNSADYKSLKNFIKNKNICFVEISYKKSNISQEKAYSDALINGAGKNTWNILEKIINEKYV
tara:strand:+ start:207 stop:563 length:357 start_codon:yes stop_codon:yes gene_type:complete